MEVFLQLYGAYGQEQDAKKKTPIVWLDINAYQTMERYVEISTYWYFYYYTDYVEKYTTIPI